MKIHNPVQLSSTYIKENNNNRIHTHAETIDIKQAFKPTNGENIGSRLVFFFFFDKDISM